MVMAIDPKDIGEEIANEYLRPILEAIESQGLTPTYLAKKLKYELDYTEPRFFAGKEAKGKRGRLKPGPKAMRVRQTARQDAHKLRGDYPAEKRDDKLTVSLEEVIKELEGEEDG